MKKLLTYFVMVVMIFSFCACGEKEDDYDEERGGKVKTEGNKLEELLNAKDKDKEVLMTEESVSGAEIVDEGEDKSTSEEEEADRYVPSPVNPYGNYSYAIKDGWWYFAADVDGEMNYQWFCYDIEAGKVVNQKGLEKFFSRDYLSDTSVLELKSDGNGGYGYWGAKLCDVVTGEVIISLKDNQRFFGSWIDGKIIVLEVIETFEKNIYSMGVLNDKGEWVQPLSSEYPWLDSSMSLRSVENSIRNGSYLGGGIYSIGDYWYDVKRNTFCDSYKIDYNWIYSACDGYVYYVTEDEAIISYNISTGESLELMGGYETWQNGEYYGFTEEGLFEKIYKDRVQLITPRGKILAEYDMSQYLDWSIQKITESGMVFVCTNASGSYYLCLMNPDGSIEFEPQKYGDVIKGNYLDKTVLTDEKLIIVSSGGYFQFDRKTKEILQRETDYNILEYLYETDKFIVEVAHPEYGEYYKMYYLVDINDLDTLINPFEMKAETTEQKTEKVEKLSDLDLIKKMISNYTDGEVFSHTVINQMSEGIEAFVLTDEIYGVNDAEYADLIESHENYGSDFHRVAGWYINGNNVKKVFVSGEKGDCEGYLPGWLYQEEIGVRKCNLLKDGTQLIQIDWSISVHNSGSIFYEIGDKDVVYAFSGNDFCYISEDGRILSYDYYYDSMTNMEQWDYIEYTYENGKLKMINSWTEYSEC